MPSTSARLLELLSLLQARRDWPGHELAARLEVSGRTVRRDIERLRGLGYPVEATTGPDGGYRLHAGAALPPLLLDDDEAVAIAVGLRTAAGAAVTGIEENAIRALVKLEQVLPPRLRRRVSALQSATALAARPDGGPMVDAETLALIGGACRDRERLRFGYSSRDGSQTRRHVEPNSLVNAGRRWYLVGFDRDRDEWRTFRIDRIDQLPAVVGRFEPRPLPGGDPAEFVSRGLSRVEYRHRARVIVHAPAESVRAAHRWAAASIEPIDEGCCRYTPSDDSLESLALRIGFLGFDFEVQEPPELAEQCVALARRFAAASGGSTTDGLTAPGRTG